ncbi:YeeE/YedE thiosulfate transporter family protein [Aliiroseovarius sediminis]|uniref:YeeE/YedE family protein n=1 Tax=Aliiroseovarius sediminis TaxID=2925839 RepID=UPI001F5A25B6|nr:YeeE/YedE thiosulfate transporter family protein [Aliiroseovarius sediminis]MCI2393627.1 YeeE/YedE family protein [Aliiroseovarius sediminis]
MIETAFTPLASALGGALIGLASVLLMWLRGNILGATGILVGFLQPGSSTDWSWRAAILAGMLTGPLIYLAATGSFPAIEVPVSTLSMIVGGLIVGVGVTYGSGCTSGHGICGNARLSPRSIVATLTFMAGTAVMVFVTRHIFGM